jgi:phospholipid N-methyltransferase
MPDVSPEPIIQVATGFMAAKLLFVANEVGLFEALAEGPATLDQLTERTAVPRRTMRIVTDAMVALGFLERQGNQYQNRPVAETFLSGCTPLDLRPFLRFFNHISYPRWVRLEEAVRTAQPIFGEFDFTEEEQGIYSQGVEALTARTAQALAAAYDFSQHRRVLDLDGGTGSFLTALLNQYSDLESTLYEMPSVAAMARQRLAVNPQAERIQIVEGNFFEDPIPGEHDAVILANIVHNFSPERNIALLKRIRKQAPDGARLLLVDFWTDPTHTQPQFAALVAGTFLISTGQGDVYSEEEVRGWLQETGWQMLERKPLAGPASLIVGETTNHRQ